MENEKKFHLKHPEIYVILFLIFLTIAIIAFVHSCTEEKKSKPGLYLVTPNTSEEIKYYADEFTFYVYLEGSNDEINSNFKNVTNIYSEYLARYYANISDDVNYTTYPSIARLNESPNEEVLLGEDVVGFLKAGYKYSEDYSNYSLFSTPLYAFWYQQCALNTSLRNARDPINNSESVDYLTKLANYVNSKDHIDLEIIGEDKAKIKVSEEYLKFREDNGITASLVSLNLIKNEQLMEKIASKLEESGFSKGYIIAKNGSILELKNSSSQTYNLYNFTESNKVEVFGSVQFTTQCNTTVYRRFDLDSSEVANTYRISKDDVTYYRSSYIDISTGLNNNVILNSSIYEAGINISQTALVNNELVKCKNYEEVKTYILSHNENEKKYALTLVNEPKKVFITTNLKENVKLNEELDYNLNII